MMLLSRGPKLKLSMVISGKRRFYAMSTLRTRGTLAVQKGDAPSPARRSSVDLHREAGHLEAKGRQLLEVREFFHMAVTDFAPGLVAFPNEAGVTGLGEPLAREGERTVPAPTVDAGDADALLGQKEGRFAAHAAALIDEVGLSVSSARRRVHQDNIEGFERVADAVEFAGNVIGLAHVTVRLGAKVEFHAIGEEP